MKNKTFILSLLILLKTINLSSTENPLTTYLQNRIPESNHRYDSFLLALSLMSENNVKTIIETGTARSGLEWCLSDGCSTIIFAEWSYYNGATLYSIDINEIALKNAERCIEPYIDSVNLIHSDSIAFLSNFNQSIDFLYLDSYDYEFDNPLPSQLHHLKEIKAAYPYLHERSIVMIDDCDLPGGGKGKFVIQYLLEKGWRIIFSQYQVILTKWN